MENYCHFIVPCLGDVGEATVPVVKGCVIVFWGCSDIEGSLIDDLVVIPCFTACPENKNEGRHITIFENNIEEILHIFSLNKKKKKNNLQRINIYSCKMANLQRQKRLFHFSV